MQKKVCCIFNLAPHYRAPIYKLLDSELNSDFYFGDKVSSPIKTMDPTILKGFKKVVRNKRIKKTGFTWQENVWYLPFKSYKYFIITGSPGCLSNWIILFLSLLLGKKTYAWSHGLRENLPYKTELLHKTFFKLCSKILLYGETSKKYMLTKGFSQKKLIPVYNSLNYELQLEIREGLLENSTVYKNHFNNDYPVLAYIGRIQKSKKVDVLVEAVKYLNDNDYPCNLVIIGNNVDGSEIDGLIDDYKLRDIIWTYGATYDEKEIAELLFNADVCVSPGLIGLTAIHALTYGLPVITSTNFSRHGPEFEAIKEGETGSFFEEDDLKNLCNSIKKWTGLNSTERNLVRKHCYEVIEKNWNPFAQIQVFKKLLIQDQ